METLSIVGDRVNASPAALQGWGWDGADPDRQRSGFGRERGHWVGELYVSESYGYRVRLLGPGWRLPQERSGVATNIEAVREDRSAVLTVALEATDPKQTLEQAADAYAQQIKSAVPEAGNVSRREAKLAGQPAVMLTYDAKAIDKEPTESRHLIAVEGGQRYVVTLVVKKKSLEAGLKHFARAVESFEFGKPAEGEQPPEGP